MYEEQYVHTTVCYDDESPLTITISSFTPPLVSIISMMMIDYYQPFDGRATMTIVTMLQF